jgi:uncharacterized protein YecE (DUF72 family)
MNWPSELLEFGRVAKVVWVYFNDDRDGYAIKNARPLPQQLES